MDIKLFSNITAIGERLMPVEYYAIEKSISPENKKWATLYYYNAYKSISAGFIHCYTQFYIVKLACDALNRCATQEKQFRVIECIIEPGTLYYRNSRQICARSITTKGVVY